MANALRHAWVITPIRLGNRTGLKLKRFVPLALLFPIAPRYWKRKPVAHEPKLATSKLMLTVLSVNGDPSRSSNRYREKIGCYMD